LNPAESVRDTIEDVDSQVLAQYMPEIEEDSDEELEILPSVRRGSNCSHPKAPFIWRTADGRESCVYS